MWCSMVFVVFSGVVDDGMGFCAGFFPGSSMVVELLVVEVVLISVRSVLTTPGIELSRNNSRPKTPVFRHDKILSSSRGISYLFH